MDRTTAYERHLERMDALRIQAVDAATLARAYDDYAEVIARAPTFGRVGDMARNELVGHARNQAARARLIAKAKIRDADKLEKEGIGDG